MNDALVQLAERCEAATGPSFELEREIADAVWRAKWGKRRPKDIAPQPCTSSLDAALMLVPEGALTWHAGKHMKTGEGQAYILVPGQRDPIYAVAATPALALTAAALRALAKEPTP